MLIFLKPSKKLHKTMGDSILVIVLTVCVSSLKITELLKQSNVFQRSLKLERRVAYFSYSSLFSVHASPHAIHFFNYGLGSRSKEEIISRQRWDSCLSVSYSEPLISVRAAVIAQGPTGLEGLAVRASRAISAPKRLELWQEATERERDKRSMCEASFDTVESCSRRK